MYHVSRAVSGHVWTSIPVSSLQGCQGCWLGVIVQVDAKSEERKLVTCRQLYE